MKQKTPIEVINETVAFYSEDPYARRATMQNSPDSCRYNTYDGRHCAVGRYLKDELKAQGVDMEANDDTVHGLANINGGLNNCLTQEVQGIDIKFWCDLQALHDSNCNWNKYGLTNAGQGVLELIIDKYAKD